MGLEHGLINYIESNAKCRHLKNWPIKGLRGRCLSFSEKGRGATQESTEAESKEKHGVWDPMLEMTIISHHVHSRVDSNKFTTGNPTPESTLFPSQGLWIWPQIPRLGWKYQYDWLYLQSLNSDKHLPHSPFTGQILRWRHFALPSMSLISTSDQCMNMMYP